METEGVLRNGKENIHKQKTWESGEHIQNHNSNLTQITRSHSFIPHLRLVSEIIMILIIVNADSNGFKSSTAKYLREKLASA